MKQPSLPGVKHIKKRLKSSARYILDHWWPIVSTLLVVMSISLLLGYKLMGLTNHHLSITEKLAYSHLASNDYGLRKILANPVNLPFSMGLYVLEKLHVTDRLAVRALSAFYGAIAIWTFYLILKRWHTRRIALLGATLFATSAWVLHTSRLGTPEVLLMSPMALILCATWLRISQWRRLTLLLSLVASLLVLYVPGMLPFVVAGLVWQSRKLFKELRQASWWFSLPWCVLGLLLLIPLVWMLVVSPGNITNLLGIPSHLPSPKQYGLNLLAIPTQLFVRGPQSPSHWLGRLPILDVFTIAMTLVGVYAYAFRYKLDRTKLLGGIFLFGSLFVALSGAVTISFLIPFIYILAAGGIALMLQQWRTVFPRNPFARVLATSIIGFAVVLATFYNINHYFIAWPQTPETKQAFKQ